MMTQRNRKSKNRLELQIYSAALKIACEFFSSELSTIDVRMKLARRRNDWTSAQSAFVLLWSAIRCVASLVLLTRCLWWSVVKEKEREKREERERRRIIGSFLSFSWRSENGQLNRLKYAYELVVSRCSGRKTMHIRQLLVIAHFFLTILIKYQIQSIILRPFYWNQTTFR